MNSHLSLLQRFILSELLYSAHYETRQAVYMRFSFSSTLFMTELSVCGQTWSFYVFTEQVTNCESQLCWRRGSQSPTMSSADSVTAVSWWLVLKFHSSLLSELLQTRYIISSWIHRYMHIHILYTSRHVLNILFVCPQKMRNFNSLQATDRILWHYCKHK